MSTIGHYYPRVTRSQAMRVLIGTTTRADIRKLVPGANVGAPTLNDDESDLRWVFLPSAPEGQKEMRHDGDWIVVPEDGPAYFLSDKQFNQRFVMA